MWFISLQRRDVRSKKPRYVASLPDQFIVEHICLGRSGADARGLVAHKQVGFFDLLDELVVGQTFAIYGMVAAVLGILVVEPGEQESDFLSILGKGAVFDFTDCTIRASTGLLQCLHRATSFVGYPQCEEETAFLRIEGNI